MEIELPVNPLSSTPLSSPHPRSSGSGHASSLSIGSSLDTVSASAHLERYEMPWSVSEVGSLRRGLIPRTRSYNAVLEWNSSSSARHHHLRNTRPLAGTSRKRLIRQIQQLTKDKADLEAQLAAIAAGKATSLSSGSSAGKGSSVRTGSSGKSLENRRRMTAQDGGWDGSDSHRRMDGTRSQGQQDVRSTHGRVDGFRPHRGADGMSPHEEEEREHGLVDGASQRGEADGQSDGVDRQDWADGNSPHGQVDGN